MNIFTKQKQAHRRRGKIKTYGYQRGKAGGG